MAQDIVRALTPEAGKFEKHADHFENERYVVTSAVGHLVEIKAPEEYDVKRGKWSFAHLPVVPPHFDLAPIDKAKSRLNAVVKLVKRKDVDRAHQRLRRGARGRADLPPHRAVRRSRQAARQAGAPAVAAEHDAAGDPRRLRRAAQRHSRCTAWPTPRAAAREADWLVGINGTRAMTAFNSRDGGFFLTTVGRVQTPTLSIVVEREEKIRKHVPRDYWEVKAAFVAAAGTYEGKWFDPKWKKKRGRCRCARRPAVERGRRARHRASGARPGRHVSAKRPSPARSRARCCTT